MAKDNKSSNTAHVPTAIPSKTVKGQKHISPVGRHSQQTHKIAQARADANGHTSEKEQHAHDRVLVLAARAEYAAIKKNKQDAKKNRRPVPSNLAAQADKIAETA